MADRGRSAERPSDLPKLGWRDIGKRVWKQIGEDNISIIAAGVAFFGLLAIFPALAALVSLYGLIADPHDLQSHLDIIAGVAPPEAVGMIKQELDRIVEGAGGRLGFGFIFGLLVALWSAMSGVKTLMTALNIAYDEEESRGFVSFNLTALLFTLGAILTVILALLAIVVVPAALATIGLGAAAEWAISLLRWPVLGVLLLLGFAVLYRYGPSRDEPKWRWVTWGAFISVVLWLIGSMLFSFYVTNFGNYNATYGSLGAIVVVMMWFYLSAFILLLGAEINSEMEHQTEKDTTEGRAQPRGRRGAYVADTVGEGT